MIQLPRRSVTRFFIPLIDVLTLLFCIFLLMPLVSATGDNTDVESADDRDQRLRQLEMELEQLRQEKQEPPPAQLEELDRLHREKIQSLQESLTIRVLEIDASTGKLYYYDPDQIEIASEADARALIERDRRAQQSSRRELYYLILYPRRISSPFPHRAQRERYEHWFKDAAHGWDVPGSAVGGSTP